MGIWIYLQLFGRQKRLHDIDHLETVSILVACFNEEQFIESKIDNLLKLKYPKDKLEIAFVTDGSTDNTMQLIQNRIDNGHKQIKLFHAPERKGKQHAVNRVIHQLQGDIVVFNDCNTIVNALAISQICQHFADGKTGVVTGEKKIIVRDADKVVSSGEGLYWRYESFLKRMDSDFYSAVGSPGELFAIRKSLYEEVPSDISIEDFYLSVKIVLKGFHNIYEPHAYASELSSASLKDEFKRKRRIATGAFRTMFSLTEIYQFKHLKFLILYFSHRVMRWMIAPIALLTLLISSCLIQETFYMWFFKIQLLMYVLALLGWMTSHLKTRFVLLYIPFYFMFMNTALFFGFVDFIRNKNNVVWEKVNRRLS